MKNGKFLKTGINVIIEKRVEGEAFEKLKQNPKFDKTEKWIDESFESLKATFHTEKQGEMLLELEEAWNSQKALYLEYAYRQGLEDS